MPTRARVRVKFCGITRADDARAAAAAGADAVGFIFHPPAKTAVTADEARDIITALPPFVTPVGVFFNAAESDVHKVIRVAAVQLLQFHGDESAEFCAQFNLPYIKTIRVPVAAIGGEDAAANIVVNSASDDASGDIAVNQKSNCAGDNTVADQIAAVAAAHPNCRALLLDTYDKKLPGGTGKTFDWSKISSVDQTLLPPLIIAGGLTADNVGDLLSQVAPYGVDVSGGIARADSPRRKSYATMQKFIQRVNNVQRVS